jgi:hypothetical protein
MEYIDQLKHKLEESKLTQSSIDLYIKNLIRLNNNQPFKNLNFLNDYDSIINGLDKYKKNTKRSYLISIVSSLNVIKDKNKKIKTLYDVYYKNMKEISEDIKKNVKTDELNETQKKGFMEYNDLIKIYDELNDVVMDDIITHDKLNRDQYNKLLTFVILSLYILMPAPRRSKDFNLMYVIFNKYDIKKHDKDRNYFDLLSKKMFFSNYKTKKVYGLQEVDVPNNLLKIIQIYLAYHPLIINNNKDDETRLLVNYDGKELNDKNGITQILNKFHNNMGSSMIRHIFISNRFDQVEKDKEKIATQMGHTTATQKTYIKHDSP